MEAGADESSLQPSEASGSLLISILVLIGEVLWSAIGHEQWALATTINRLWRRRVRDWLGRRSGVLVR